MRNGQNKRMRGRNQHRKSHNPMTRVYESNGPDVKIRGNPSHIAEKYVQLARDAQSSGDPVAAENYYQHAEHYFRLIAAAQEQFRQSNPQAIGPTMNPARQRHADDPRDDSFEEGDDDGQPRMGSGERAVRHARAAALHPARRAALSTTPAAAAATAAPAAPRMQRKARATSIGCRPSSPAATRRSRSTTRAARAKRPRRSAGPFPAASPAPPSSRRPAPRHAGRLASRPGRRWNRRILSARRVNLESLSGRIFLRKTGVHFSGKCSIRRPAMAPARARAPAPAAGVRAEPESRDRPAWLPRRYERRRTARR